MVWVWLIQSNREERTGKRERSSLESRIERKNEENGKALEIATDRWFPGEAMALQTRAENKRTEVLGIHGCNPSKNKLAGATEKKTFQSSNTIAKMDQWITCKIEELNQQNEWGKPLWMQTKEMRLRGPMPTSTQKCNPHTRPRTNKM